MLVLRTKTLQNLSLRYRDINVAENEDEQLIIWGQREQLDENVRPSGDNIPRKSNVLT